MQIDTSSLSLHKLPPEIDHLQLYNALDCALTYEIWEKLQPLISEEPSVIYDFARAMQGPALDIMLRGWRVDQEERQRGIVKLSTQLDRLRSILNKMAGAIWDKGLNARSPKQLQEFFFDAMRVPKIWSSKKGVRKLSMDREALEKIEVYLYPRIIAAAVLAIRDTAKRLEVLTTEVDPDSRFRTSLNIGGTETGRFSSSQSTYGTGSNMQNITAELRRMFVADPGYKICAIDLEQAESREVGWLCGTLFNDWSYLDACEGGDLHTYTCRLVWPHLEWSGDIKRDRSVADRVFYRHFTYRDMSKRGGHGTNYLGTPFTMARHLKVPTKLIEDFQERYFDAFPGIPRWHRWVAEQLQTTRELTTPFGRTRTFFGRPNDETTLREAIAYVPQSATADRLNLGLWRIWKHLGNCVQVLLQLHDAVYFQYPEEEDEEAIVNAALKLVEVKLRHGDRVMVVPGEAKVGWNWGNYSEANLDGLKKYYGSDTRTRTLPLPFLERLV